jgi:hypothetical protein
MMKLGTLALGLAVAATASPSFAQSNRASTNRAQAIQDCNGAAGKYVEHLWGNMGRQIYRTCMAEHDQPE